MKYKRNICIYAYLHNLCILVIFFITIKTWIWWITSFESIFTEKPEEILSFLMHFTMKIRNFFRQNSSKICIFKIVINYLKKSNGPKKKFFIFLFYLTCFTTVPNFESIGPLVAEIWGGGHNQPPPPPQWTQVLEIYPMGMRVNQTG